MQRLTLGLILVALTAPTDAGEAGCYCLENYTEVRFLWNCHDDDASSSWSVCTRPRSNGTNGVTRVQMTDDWDRYEAGTPQCGPHCLPPDSCTGGAVRGNRCPE